MTQTFLIHSDQTTEIPKCGSFTRIDRMSIIADDSTIIEYFNQRVSILVNVSSLSSDGRHINIECAIGSFIIGQDFDHSCNIIFSSSDNCTLSTVGAPVQIQVLYTVI